MAVNDADIRFKATLDDDVSAKADQIENKLKKLGYTTSEIKMYLRMQDEASSKVSAFKKMLSSIPTVHMVDLRARTDDILAKHAMVKRKIESDPIHLSFTDNLKDIGDKMFNLRSRAAIPFLGDIPGANQLAGVGVAGAGVIGGVTALAGVIKQGVEVNSQMEQSMVQLQQTLKDNTKAQAEQGKLVQIAQQTPFNYKDVLQADVRLRSYNIPSMQGEGGPNNQGWLQSAGNMAAALNTPITQAVEAIADARQGYFVRMMSYGIRMMREDFQAGGKYGGETYEQGLGQAIRRFDGAMVAQSKTFQGVMSNIQDVLQQQVLRPVGAVPFEALKQGATSLQDKLTDPDFQLKLGQQIEKVQHVLIGMFSEVQKGKQYFTENLEKPLMDIGKAVMNISKTFITTFGGVFKDVLTTIGQLLYGIGKPLLQFVNAHPQLVQVYATFKALSILGFDGPVKGLKDMASSMSLLHPSIFGLIRGFREFTSGLVKLGIAELVKGFVDAHAASEKLKSSLTDRKWADSFKEVNAEISKMSGGLDQSATNMKKLAADSIQHLGKGGSLDAGIYQAKMAATFQRDYGVNANLANTLMSGEGIKTKDDVNDASVALRRLKAVTDELGMSMKDAARIMKEFGGPAKGVGLGGLQGAPYLSGLSAAIHQTGFMDTTQTQQGIYTGDELMRQMLTTGAAPSTAALQKIGTNNLPSLFNFNNTRFMGALNQMGPFQGAQAGAKEDFGTTVRTQYQSLKDNITQLTSNNRLQSQQQAEINKITGAAGMQRGVQLPDLVLEGRRTMPNPDDLLKGTPDQQGKNLANARQQIEEQLKHMNDLTDKYTQNTNDLQKELNNWSNAQQRVNMQMEQAQHALVPLQHQIEDLQLAVQKYSFDALRPLERQMQSLQQTSAQMQNQQANASWNMSKWTEGLLTGEQAALDQQHALEGLNRQIQIMQLQYQQIGAELGTTLYDQGARIRVDPLSNFTLAAQQERLARQQQLAQLRYDDSFGEKHYQLQQAARPQNERTERDFNQRLEGIKKNVPILDQLNVAQHNLSNQQFDLQEKINDVNNNIQNQQDALTGLQIKLTDRSLHGGMREMQEAQYQFGQKTEKANMALTQQQSLLATVQDRVTTYRDIGQKLQTWFQDILGKPGDPNSAIEQILKVGQASGLLNDKQTADLRKALANIQSTVQSKDNSNVPSTKADWIDVFKKGIEGLVTGDTWRRLGDVIKNAPGVGQMGVVGNAIGSPAVAAGLTAATTLIALRAIPFIARQAVIRPIGAIGGRVIPGAAGRGFSRASRWAAGGGFMEGLLDAANLMKAFRSLIGGIGGSILGGIAGGPVGSFLGGIGGARYGANSTLRGMARDVVHPVQAVRRGMANIFSKFGDRFEHVVDKFRKGVQNHAEVLDKDGKIVHTFINGNKGNTTRFGEWVHNMGEHVKGLGDRLGTFKDTVKDFGKWVDTIPGVQDAKKAAAAASDFIKDALKVGGRASTGTDLVGAGAEGAGRAGRLGSLARGALKWGGRAAMVGAAGESAWQALHGNWAGAANTASYLVPVAGEAHLGLDAFTYLNHILGGDKASAAGRMPQAQIDQRAFFNALGRGQQLAAQRGSPFAPIQATPGGSSGQPDPDWSLQRQIDWYKKHGMPEFAKNLEDLLDTQKKHDQKDKEQAQSHTADKQKIDSDARTKAVKDRDDANADDEKTTGKHFSTMSLTVNSGWKAITTTTREWIDKVNGKIKGIDDDLGLTHGKGGKTVQDTGSDIAGTIANATAGLAHGGLLKGDPHKIGPGRLIRVNEEGHDEVIIPLAPHRRERAKMLVDQVRGQIGAFANGGHVMSSTGLNLLTDSDGKRSPLNDLIGNMHGIPLPTGAIKAWTGAAPSWVLESGADGTGAAARSDQGIWVKNARDRQSLLHELGHFYDYHNMDDARRQRFEQIIHAAKRPWRDSGGNSPHEQFAEAYHMAAIGLVSTNIDNANTQFPGGVGPGYGFDANAQGMKKIAALLRGNSNIMKLANGGMIPSHSGTDGAYLNAAASYKKAAQMFANGGTAVVGDSLEVGTLPYLKGLIGNVYSDAQTGRSSASGLAALKTILSRHKDVSQIIFDLGTNDGSASALRSSLSQADKISGHIPILAATVHGPAAAAKNALLRSMAGGDISLADWVGHSQGLIGPDGIHATGKGYAQRAQLLAQALHGGGVSAAGNTHVSGWKALEHLNVMPFANGGFTGPHGSLPWGTPLANFAKQKFGMWVSAGRTDHGAMTAGGRPSAHAWGGALDLQNKAGDGNSKSSETPEEWSFVNFIKSKASQLIGSSGQMIFDNKIQLGSGTGAFVSGHMNHVHFGIARQYANEAKTVAKILADAEKGVNFDSLLIGGGSGGGSALPSLHLPGIPGALKSMGPLGNIYYEALKKKKKIWETKASGALDVGSAGLGMAFHGGGNAQANMRLGKRMAAAMGWTGNQWDALRQLWIGESGWQTRIGNKSSGAYGIPQSLPASKMASAGSDYLTNPATQIKWGLGYIKNRYHSPAQALSAWLGRSPHWYASGSPTLKEDQFAMLHRGEKVLHPAEASGHDDSPKSRKQAAAWDALLDIKKDIREAKDHLKKIKDASEKKDAQAHLSQLNDELRQRYQRVATTTRQASSELKSALAASGDKSGGEQTLAGVTTQKEAYQHATNLKVATKQDRDRVRETRTLHKSAESLVKTAKTHHEKVLAQTAVKKTDTAVKAARKVTRYEGTKSGKRAVVELARNSQLEKLAKGGTNEKLLKSITGKGLSGRTATLYKRAASAKSGSSAQQKALKDLATNLKHNESAQGKKLDSLRSNADKAAKAARAATEKAAKAQGKEIDKNGKVIKAATGKAAAKTSKDAKKHADDTKKAITGTSKKQVDEARKGSDETKKSAAETKKVKKATEDADAKRSKAEDKADQRDRKHQKAVEDMLERLIRKDLSVNINNKAEGAKLTTTVVRGAKKKR